MTKTLEVTNLTSWLDNLEKLSLNFSSSSFVSRVNLLRPQPFSFRLGSLLPPWCLYITRHYFEISFALPEFMEKCGEWSDTNSCRDTKTDIVSPNVLEKQNNNKKQIYALCRWGVCPLDITTDLVEIIEGPTKRGLNRKLCARDCVDFTFTIT